ncbi:hypothetical protein [Halalkalibacter alkaliphilus]|uniref:Uncharacterized protein n=1 Tax=Halalkalibacter alkaliphilus TaxID=2917993 RepID=A0A9X2I9H1_9BACI|nr:hypothetical protein [Halalkalibacter alkaliphilus]MCL7748750.1 hypothetical protein [Halalkalibacter alkaliphilus]
MVNYSVKDKFEKDEYSVYADGGVFHFHNASLVGEKSFFITNKGRVFGYDSGGFFGEEQVRQYNRLINVECLNYGNVRLTNETSSPFTFNVTLPYDKFIDLYNKLPKNKVFINKEGSKYPCLFTYKVKGHKVLTAFSYDSIELKDDAITFQSSGLGRLPFNRVDQANQTEKCIELKGWFSNTISEITEVNLYIFDEQLKSQLMDKLEQQPSIFNYVHHDAELFEAQYVTYVQQETVKFEEIILSFDEKKISLISSTTNELIHQLPRNDTSIYYDGKENTVVFEYKKMIDIVQISTEKLHTYLQTHVTRDQHTVHIDIGYLSGSFFGEKKDQELISLLISPTTISFFQLETNAIIKQVNVFDGIFFLDRNLLFIVYGKEVSSIKLEKQLPETLLQRVTNQTTLKLGYMADFQPFYIVQDEKKVVLYQSDYVLLKQLFFKDFIDVSITKQPEEQSLFTEVTIKTANDQKMVLYFDTELVKTFIHHSYYFPKRQSLPNVSGEQMYVSYSRQVNDFVLFQFFGQMFAMYKGLKEIERNETDIDKRNKAIINYIYYSIQSLKKHFDMVSVYLPSSLENEVATIFEGQAMQQPFKKLQRHLMGISNQLNRSLNEIESSVAAVSHCLIKREDYNQLVKDRTKRDYQFSAGLGITGVASAAFLSGGLSIIATPFLVAGFSNGISTYLRSEDAKKEERLRKKDEGHKVSFYVDRMYQSLEHLVQAMFPYYISETNDIIYDTYQQLHQEISPKLGTVMVKENLFQKISAYYTFKQLPIDESVTTQRRELIDFTHEAVNLSQQYIDQFSKEVEVNVPEPIAITTK